MPLREAVVGRELTKLHEEVLRGTLASLAASADDREWLGEITVVIAGAPDGEQTSTEMSQSELDRAIDEALAHGRRVKDIAEGLALRTGRPRRALYEQVLARRNRSAD